LERLERGTLLKLGACAAAGIQIRPALGTEAAALGAMRRGADRLERDLELKLLSQDLVQIDEFLRNIRDVKVFAVKRGLVVGVASEAGDLSGGFVAL
jgi:hypothetical protein